MQGRDDTGKNSAQQETKAEVCLPAGSILQGRYQTERVLRERNTDIFYSALDRQLNRRVRIQEYFPHRKSVKRSGTEVRAEASGQEKFQKGLEDFCRNGQKLAGLCGEEDIVRVFSAFRENNTAYLVTEERDCMTLADALEEGPFPEAEALEILEAAGNALDKCHEAGVCHGMIEPENFWLLGNRREGEYGLVLKDFGIGKPAGEISGTEKDVCDLARMYVRLVPAVAGVREQGSRGRQLRADTLPPVIARTLEHEIRTTGDFLRALTGQTEETETRRSAVPAWAERKKAELAAFRMNWVLRAVLFCTVFFAVFGAWTAVEHIKTAEQKKQLAAARAQTQTKTEETSGETVQTATEPETVPETPEPEPVTESETVPAETLPQEGQTAPAEEAPEEQEPAEEQRTVQTRRTTAAQRRQTAQTRAVQPETAAQTTIAPKPEDGNTGETVTIEEGSVARADFGSLTPGTAAASPAAEPAQTQSGTTAQTQEPQELPTARQQEIQLVEPRE